MCTLNISFNDDPPMIQNDTKDGSGKKTLFLDLGPSHLKRYANMTETPKRTHQNPTLRFFSRDPTVLQLPVHLPPT